MHIQRVLLLAPGEHFLNRAERELVLRLRDSQVRLVVEVHLAREILAACED